MNNSVTNSAANAGVDDSATVVHRMRGVGPHVDDLLFHLKNEGLFVDGEEIRVVVRKGDGHRDLLVDIHQKLVRDEYDRPAKAGHGLISTIGGLVRLLHPGKKQEKDICVTHNPRQLFILQNLASCVMTTRQCRSFMGHQIDIGKRDHLGHLVALDDQEIGEMVADMNEFLADHGIPALLYSSDGLDGSRCSHWRYDFVLLKNLVSEEAA